MRKTFYFYITFFLILLNFSKFNIYAHGPATYGADDVKAIKINGANLWGYPNSKDDLFLGMSYHQGMYSIIGYHYELEAGFDFTSKSVFSQVTGGVGFLFFYLDLGLLYNFTEQGSLGISYGLSTFFFNNYSEWPLFFQFALKSQHYFSKNDTLNEGFMVRLSVGYRFNLRDRYNR